MAKRARSTSPAKLIIFGFRLDRPKYVPLIRLTYSISPSTRYNFSSSSYSRRANVRVSLRVPQIADEIKLRSTLRTLIANKINVKRLTRV